MRVNFKLPAKASLLKDLRVYTGEKEKDRRYHHLVPMFDKNIQTYYMPISSKLNEKTDPVFVEATPIDQQYQLFYKKIVNGEQADSGNGSLVLIDKQLHANDEVRVVFSVQYKGTSSGVPLAEYTVIFGKDKEDVCVVLVCEFDRDCPYDRLRKS